MSPRAPLRAVWLALLVTTASLAQAKAPPPALRCSEARDSGDAAADVARDFKPGVAPRIFLALGRDRYATLKQVLAAGDDPNACHAGISPLMLAIASGDLKAVTMLLDAGARTDSPRDAIGATPLQHALSAPQFAIAGLLLDRGADARLVDDGAKTALHSLALQPLPPAPQRALQIALAGRLLRLQVPLNAVHVQGSTALHMAIASGNLDLMSFLLDQHADPALPNKRGEDALAYARRLGHAALVARLEQHLAKVADPAASAQKHTP